MLSPSEYFDDMPDDGNDKYTFTAEDIEKYKASLWKDFVKTAESVFDASAVLTKNLRDQTILFKSMLNDI